MTNIDGLMARYDMSTISKIVFIMKDRELFKKNYWSSYPEFL